eukprot:IDg12392t1
MNRRKPRGVVAMKLSLAVLILLTLVLVPLSVQFRTKLIVLASYRRPLKEITVAGSEGGPSFNAGRLPSKQQDVPLDVHVPAHRQVSAEEKPLEMVAKPDIYTILKFLQYARLIGVLPNLISLR